MRVLKSFGCIAAVAVLAACSSKPAPPQSEQLDFLKSKGVVVDESKLKVTTDGHLNFPLGVCNAEFFFSGGRAHFYVYYTLAYPIEQLQGDSIADAGKTASTMFCLQAPKAPMPPA